MVYGNDIQQSLSFIVTTRYDNSFKIQFYPAYYMFLKIFNNRIIRVAFFTWNFFSRVFGSKKKKKSKKGTSRNPFL